jgi:hypothetical protein
MNTTQSRSAGPFVTVLLLWLIAACAVGVDGRVAELHPPLPQALIAVLTALLLWAGSANRGFNEWLAQVSLRRVVAFHLTRFVGFAFLALYSRGELPEKFAVPAGWGDIAVATLALGIVVFVPRPGTRPGLLLVWNALGFADILNVVFTAAGQAIANPESMSALMRFPMSLVPTFLVPLIIASHMLVFWRLMRLAAAEGTLSKLVKSRPAKPKS